ncbi:hypothetical protein PGT21_001946 [Puccinia graminis f. sp. tritici]|uniref:Uncharacterized protein n=1 Tax=Puccinia graminis f. sp. tritici TaxID=56615 RepID=A0A5B0PVP1_PUCGR|nr:hypothetical protein PGT21_001946 [Puccinia graminis f. sp. tritici]KAA1105106.1 hypothetical protein PGTUg99_050081 [Puccinia graminis f. sp. tritici]
MATKKSLLWFLIFMVNSLFGTRWENVPLYLKYRIQPIKNTTIKASDEEGISHHIQTIKRCKAPLCRGTPPHWSIKNQQTVVLRCDVWADEEGYNQLLSQDLPGGINEASTCINSPLRQPLYIDIYSKREVDSD